MSLRTTLLLIVIGVGVGVVVWVNPFKKEEETQGKAPWFYQVTEDDIQVIEVKHRDQQVKFVRDADEFWQFENLPGVSPTHRRWGGMVLMLTGPRTRRLLQDEIKTPAQFGLDSPETVVKVVLKDGRGIDVKLGNKTTDGEHHYGQVEGFDELFLITSGWGNVLTQLATEPPLPEWFIGRNTADIAELSIIRSTHHGGDDTWLQFKIRDGGWKTQRFGLDTKSVKVDLARWTAEGVPLLTGPKSQTVFKAHVKDFSPYGIFEKSSGIHMRWEGISQRGTKYDEGIVYRIGAKTEDGKSYYARTEEGEIDQPVLLLDAEWVDAVFALDTDPPYGEAPTRYTPTPATSTDSEL